MRKSAKGYISSPLGFGNSVFWSSLFTACNPGKTAQYYFRQIVPGSYLQSLFIEDTDYGREALWKLLSDAGYRVAIIDMVRGPLTPGINGIQVVDWLAHDITGTPRSWPIDLITEVEKKYGSDPLGGNADYAFNQATDKAKICEQMIQRIETKTAMSVEYFKQGPWDLFMTIYSESHDVGHTSWHLHDKNHPMHDAALVSKLGDPVKKVFVALDNAIGTLIEEVGDDASVMLCTGPGIGPLYTASHLLDQVLMQLEPDYDARRSRQLSKVQAFYRMIIPNPLRAFLKNLAMSVEDQVLENDRSNRKAFAIPHNENSGAIRINLAGREPNGKVRPGEEYDAICEELSRELLQLVNKDTGNPVVDEVVRIDQHFSGDKIHHLPDLLAVWNRSSPIRTVMSPKIGEIQGDYPGTRTGDHTPNGMFLLSGPGIREEELPGTYSVMDLGVTLCSMFDVALPDTDGLPITFSDVREVSVSHGD